MSSPQLCSVSYHIYSKFESWIIIFAIRYNSKYVTRENYTKLFRIVANLNGPDTIYRETTFYLKMHGFCSVEFPKHFLHPAIFGIYVVFCCYTIITSFVCLFCFGFWFSFFVSIWLLKLESSGIVPYACMYHCV